MTGAGASTRKGRWRRGLPLLLALAAGAPAAGAEDASALSLTDLAAYRSALERLPAAPPSPVGFRDLWERPEAYRGKAVRVGGRLVRRFRQDAVGTFPPLVEAWAVSPSGDPFCLVFPEGKDKGNAPGPGSQVRFVGTFLRKIRYASGDGDRLAPLVVGPSAPITTASSPAAPTPGSSLFGTFGAGGWAAGLAAAAMVVVFLGRIRLRRPAAPRSRLGGGPPPTFVSESESVQTAPGIAHLEGGRP